LNAMTWTGAEQWTNAKRGLWMVDNTQGGWSKELGNLKFVTVYNSGHMVPYNVPAPAFDLLGRLLTNATFIDVELAQVRVKPAAGVDPTSVLQKMSASIIHPRQSQQQQEVAASMMLQAGTTTTGLNHWHMIGVSITSLIVGFVLAMLTVRRGGRRGGEVKYQRIV
jgi:hypothetical protein